MGNNITVLSKCILFKHIKMEAIQDFIKKTDFIIKNYEKEQLVAVEEDPCTSIGIILKGNVEVQKVYPSGKVTTLARLSPADIFGEAVMFSKNRQYPATIVSISHTEIIYISREQIIKICRESSWFLKNFMELLSNKILFLNKKVTILSFKTLRQKICDYLLDEYKKQNNLKLNISLSRKKMAEHMGVQRPSLSRELIRMQDEGFIKINKKYITINNLETLNNLLFE